MTELTPPDLATVSRRRVACGVAWAAPAIIAVTAAPAFAASPPNGCLQASFYQDDLTAPGWIESVTVEIKNSCLSDVKLASSMSVRICLPVASTSSGSCLRSVLSTSASTGNYTSSVTGTTRCYTWTIPSGTTFLANGGSSADFVINLGDGWCWIPAGRVSNDVVVTAVTQTTLWGQTTTLSSTQCISTPSGSKCPGLV